MGDIKGEMNMYADDISVSETEVKGKLKKIKNNPVNIIFRQKQVCFIFECQAVMVIYLLRQMNHQRRIDRFVCKHISFHIRIPPFSIFYAAFSYIPKKNVLWHIRASRAVASTCFCFARVRILAERFLFHRT